MSYYHAPYIEKINHYIVEEIKSARRYIKRINKSKKIDDCKFTILDKHKNYNTDENYHCWLNEGHDVALMSEAGTPCIADPGHTIVWWAQQNNIKVIPLTGFSSILMALMASGLNGQNFSFNGYLPITIEERTSKLQYIITQIIKTGYTQIFIETPHRNNSILEFFSKNLPKNFLLTIAQDISGFHEYIKTKSINDWNSNKITLEKLPTIYIIGKK
jgi:16S rRNA (cytidine1402-2'-O)-methyltransferase